MESPPENHQDGLRKVNLGKQYSTLGIFYINLNHYTENEHLAAPSPKT